MEKIVECKNVVRIFTSRTFLGKKQETFCPW